jgi:hypothetical protein
MDRKLKILGHDPGGLASNIITAIIVCVFTALATFAMAKGTSPSQAEVKSMISESEQRTLSMISEIKADQKTLLSLQQNLLAEQAKLSGRFEAFTRK